MAKGHRSQIKRERNANKDTRPSAKLSYARVSVQKACFGPAKCAVWPVRPLWPATATPMCCVT